jgi:GNAT superfamily N-acetyltransferase
MKKRVLLPSLRAPRGFRFKVIEQYSSVKVSLLRDGSEVGHIHMYKPYPYKKKTRLETHSWLCEDYRGRGIGTLLYSRAIEWGLKNGWKVQSSGGSSEMAQRVWNGKGVRQHFRIRRRDTNYGTHVWFAYGKPVPKKGVKNGQKRPVR